MSTYYVATTGDNANDGSQSTPWAEIQYGIDQCSPGDTLKIEEGTYIEAIDINKDDLTVESVGSRDNTILDVSDSAQVTGKGITSSVAYNAVSITADNVTVNGLSVTGGGEAGFNEHIHNGFKADQHDNITINNCKCENIVQASWGGGVGFDLYAIKDSTLEGCVSRNNGGAAVFVSGCQNVDITLNSSENNWGSIGIGDAGSGEPQRDTSPDHSILGGTANIRIDDDNQFNEPIDNGTPAVWIPEGYTWSTTEDGSQVIFLDNRITAILNSIDTGGDWFGQTFFYAVPDGASKTAVQAAIDGVAAVKDGSIPSLTGPAHLGTYPTLRNFRTNTVYVDNPDYDWRIQDGIRMAQDGDEIMVVPGTFTGGIQSIDKAVTINGNNKDIDPVDALESRESETIITRVDTGVPNADNVVLNGLVFDNVNSTLFHMTNDFTNFTLKNCIFQNHGNSNMLFLPTPGNKIGLIVKDCLFRDEPGYCCFWGNKLIDAVIDHCKFDDTTNWPINVDAWVNSIIKNCDFDRTPGGYSIQLANATDGITIENNIFRPNNESGIKTWVTSTDNPANVTIRKNWFDLDANNHSGYYQSPIDMIIVEGDLIIEDNTILTHGRPSKAGVTANGIRLRGTPYDTLRIRNNVITCMGLCGLNKFGNAGIYIKDRTGYGGMFAVNNEMEIVNNKISGFELGFLILNTWRLEVTGGGETGVNGTYGYDYLGIGGYYKLDSSGWTITYSWSAGAWQIKDPSDVVMYEGSKEDGYEPVNGASPGPSAETIVTEHESDALSYIDLDANDIRCDTVVNEGGKLLPSDNTSRHLKNNSLVRKS